MDIPAGAVLARAHLCLKSPGTGIAPWRLNDVLGRIAPVAIMANTLVPAAALTWPSAEEGADV